jgi:hypothetical protein
MPTDNKAEVIEHYSAKYVHWDWVLDIQLSALEAAASKYLARLGKKADSTPLKDLGKVRNYIVKMLEESPRLIISMDRLPRRWIIQQTEKYCKANGIEGYANRITVGLALWETPADLQELIRLTDRMIDDQTRNETAAKFNADCVQPVPLEDSNKHAERSTFMEEKQNANAIKS